VDPVRQAFRAFRNEFQENAGELRPIYAQQMRQTLSRVHDQLDNDLNQVPITTNFLKAEIANADVVYKKMWDSMELRLGEADGAITDAINGQVSLIIFVCL